MELVTSIKFEYGMALASAEDSRSEIPIDELGTRGIPETTARLAGCTLDFQDFHDGAFQEYARFFKQPMAEKANHSTWSVIHSGTRYVIPALALIRAFAHPNRILIPKIFKPQSIDDIFTYAGCTDDYFVRPVRNRGGGRIPSSQTVTEILSWFYCFPSARRAWASVYQSAREGALHFELPEATATFRVRGVQADSTNYVTQLKVQSIEAHEQPFDFAVGHPTYISKYPGRKYFNAKGPIDNNYQKLSQSEWDGIVPVLNSYHGTTRPGIDTRSLIDCILQRLSTNVSWQTAANMNGVNFKSAAKTMQRWQADGRIGRVIQRLREMRDDGETHPNTSGSFDVKEPLNINNQELSQAEWDAVSPLLGDYCFRGAPSIDNRSLVNCLWQWLSFNVSLRTAANMNGVPLKRAEATIARWRADGRYDRVVKRLSEISNADEVHSNTFKNLGSRRPLGTKSLKLSQAEWHAITPLLATNYSLHANPDHDIRAQLNCILQKLSSKVSWQTAAKVNGVPLGRVESTLRRWRADERLDRVVERLQQLRNAREA